MDARKIRNNLWKKICIISTLIPLTFVQAAEWQLPTALIEKISGLEPQQQSFILTGDALDFLPAMQLIHEIETRDAADIQVMINDLLIVAAEMGYDPTRDMGAIPLSLSGEGFNLGTIIPAPLRKMKRKPGPFSVHRYMFPQSGVQTFAGAKIAIYPEDLVAGDVDVAIIGIPNDMGSGRRNAEYGPRVMRAMNTIATRDVQSLLDPMEVLSVVDYGDFTVDNMSTEKSLAHVTAMVAETAATGAIPIMVGGDTSILYPAVKGLASFHGKKTFGLVHFSAHPDVERQAVHTISDTQAVFRLLNEGILDGDDIVQIGLRGQAVNVDTLKWLRAEGVRYHTMAEIDRRGYAKVLKKVKKEVNKGPSKLFVSIDVSVIEPTEMVSAGRIVSNGLRVQQVTTAIRYLCAAKEIVGFEITDMSPMLDYSRLSAVNANAVLNACLVGIAVRTAGLKPDYVHPLALDHGN
ncbi:MAG: arginase family enzyme [Paraglaciecola sp.]|jgi:arginase family enzyme